MVSSSKSIRLKRGVPALHANIKVIPSYDALSALHLKYDSLKAHNEYRRKHNVAPLKWSERLAENAQKWADYLGVHGEPEHAHSNQREGEGENIFYGKGVSIDGGIATKQWYSAIKDFDFTRQPTYSANTDQFTQVIWASTTELGVGKSKATDGTEYIVARYAPPGNNLNGFEENIKPPANIVRVINLANIDYDSDTDDDLSSEVDSFYYESDLENGLSDIEELDEEAYFQSADHWIGSSTTRNKLSEYELFADEHSSSFRLEIGEDKEDKYLQTAENSNEGREGREGREMSKGNLSAEENVCTLQVSGNQYKSITFNQRIITPGSEHPSLRYHVIDLSILTHPKSESKEAYFRTRKDAYLKHDVSYVLTHGYYL